MRLDEPPWWYRERPGLIAGLLFPFSIVWDWFGRRRFRVVKPYRSRLPVICIGNFTAGGSGKTPMALYVGERLLARGVTPCFLTRGFAGKAPKPHFVDPDRDPASKVGDETLLLARMGLTMMSRNRAVGAKLIEERVARDAKPMAIVMDDGLQNASLVKDLAIAMVDGRRGIGNGLTIPSGPLRIGLRYQLGLVHAIVINHGADRSKPLSRSIDKLRKRFADPIFEADVRPRDDGSFRGAKVIAYAGIVNPNRFFDLLTDIGAEVQERVAFPDHHAFSEHEAERLLRRADRTGCTLVTTEKDLARLSGQSGARGDLARRSRVVAIDLAPTDTAAFDALIERALNSLR